MTVQREREGREGRTDSCCSFLGELLIYLGSLICSSCGSLSINEMNQVLPTDYNLPDQMGEEGENRPRPPPLLPRPLPPFAPLLCPSFPLYFPYITLYNFRLCSMYPALYMSVIFFILGVKMLFDFK